MPDFRITDHGSVWLAEPLTLAANDWLLEHVDLTDSHWHGGALMVEPRYVADLAAGMAEAGLDIEGA